MTTTGYHLRKWFGIAAMAFVSVVVLAGQAIAATPLVDVAWVKANAGKPGIVLLDVQSPVDYLRAHIPGAVNTNYEKDGWRVKENGVPGMLPHDTSKLAQTIGNLGIGNVTHVVLVAPGKDSTDMGIATRLYWTFKVLGHDNVSILDGGMQAYLAEVDKQGKPVNALDKGPAKATPQSFSVSLRKEMLVNRDDVKAAMDKGIVLVDNRPSDQYLGVNRTPVAAANGTIPHALNMPQSWLTQNGGGTFRSKQEIEKLYKVAGVPTAGQQISFCNTGHWASVGWFASSEVLGNKDVKLYDGSMAEWTHAKMPLEVKIQAK